MNTNHHLHQHGLVMYFFKKFKGLLLEPLQSLNTCKEETLYEAMKDYRYFIAIISAIVAMFFVIEFNKIDSIPGFGNFGIAARIGLGVIMGIVVFIFSILRVWIEGTLIHIGVYLLGGRKGINQTIKAVIYSTYVWILLALIFGFLEQIPYINKIPFINDISEIIFFIWPLAIMILGVQRFHEITTLRAIIGASLIPVIIPAILGIIIMGLMPEEYKNYASNEDSIFSIEPTSDSGYIIAGSTESSGTGVDAWLIKIDANGNLLWSKMFGDKYLNKSLEFKISSPGINPIQR